MEIKASSKSIYGTYCINYPTGQQLVIDGFLKLSFLVRGGSGITFVRIEKEIKCIDAESHNAMMRGDYNSHDLYVLPDRGIDSFVYGAGNEFVFAFGECKCTFTIKDTNDFEKLKKYHTTLVQAFNEIEPSKNKN